MSGRMQDWWRAHRAEFPSTVAFAVTTVSGIALAVVYWTGGQPQLEGLFLATAFSGLCIGLVIWANHLLDPGGPYEEKRHPLATTKDEKRAFERDLERGGMIERRTLLLKGLGAALGALGVAALFPIRSLGPRPGNSLLRTPWRNGSRLVNEAGTPVNTSDVPLNGLVTVFPENAPGSADGQAVLIRVPPGLLEPHAGRADWAPDGFVCYSKICTHAGCPVGLYEARDHQLLCPCHQSTFDVLRAAKPVFGPAAAALPQLPLRIDGNGFLVARGDFSEPVGPAFWNRT
jgi:ubiquinol-cytochrome c reductase iron-sulfur subunit